jgi:hypothetical protein
MRNDRERVIPHRTFVYESAICKIEISPPNFPLREAIPLLLRAP